MRLVNDEKDGFFAIRDLPVDESKLEARGCVIKITPRALEWICEKMVDILPWGSRIMETRGVNIEGDGSLRVFFTHPELPVVREGDDFPVLGLVD